MPKEIVIVGGLLEEVDFRAVIDVLTERTTDYGIKWSWVYSELMTGFAPKDKVFRRLLEEVRQARRPGSKTELQIAKLFHLHPRSQNQLYRACPEPVLVPKEVADANSLVDWLLSTEANLVPKQEWIASLKEASIVAILAKLLKNKDWNKDTQGHNWTKENDLLAQAPVLRPNFQQIAVEAKSILDRLRGTLLLRKGSGQGNTPREWSINTSYLSLIKQSILQQSLEPLKSVPQLAQLIDEAAAGERLFMLTDDVISERVREVCRQVH